MFLGGLSYFFNCLMEQKSQFSSTSPLQESILAGGATRGIVT